MCENTIGGRRAEIGVDGWRAGRVASGNVLSVLPLLVALRRVLPRGGAGLRSRPRAAYRAQRLAAVRRSGTLPPSRPSPPGAALANPQAVGGWRGVSDNLPKATRRIADARNRAGPSLVLLAAAGGSIASSLAVASGRPVAVPALAVPSKARFPVLKMLFLCRFRSFAFVHLDRLQVLLVGTPGKARRGLFCIRLVFSQCKITYLI